jgi:hypothetical protein
LEEFGVGDLPCALADECRFDASAVLKRLGRLLAGIDQNNRVKEYRPAPQYPGTPAVVRRPRASAVDESQRDAA